MKAAPYEKVGLSYKKTQIHQKISSKDMPDQSISATEYKLLVYMINDCKWPPETRASQRPSWDPISHIQTKTATKAECNFRHYQKNVREIPDGVAA